MSANYSNSANWSSNHDIRIAFALLDIDIDANKLRKNSNILRPVFEPGAYRLCIGSC